MSFRERWPGSRIAKWIFGALAAVVAYVALLVVLSPVMFPVFDKLDREYWRKEEIEESRRLREKWQRDDRAAEKEGVPSEAPPMPSEKKAVKKSPQVTTLPKAKKAATVSSQAKTMQQRPAPVSQPKAKEPKEGTLSRGAIEAGIKPHFEELYTCYYRARTYIDIPYEQAQEAAGIIKVRFVIETDGTVKVAEVVDDGVGLPRLPECLVATFRRMQFPPPAGEGTVTVRYPLIFAEKWMRKYPELVKQAAP